MGLPENAQRCVRLIDDCVCGAVVVDVGRLPFRELKEREKYAKKKKLCVFIPRIANRPILHDCV